MSVPPLIPYAATRRYRPLFAAARDGGIELDGLLAEFGFTEGQLLDPSTRVPSEHAFAIFVRLLARSPSPELGIKAANLVELQDLSAAGYLLRHAANALEGLHMLARYSRLGSDTHEVRVETQTPWVIMSGWLSGGRPFHPLALDFTVGGLVRCLHLISDGRAQPVEAQLPRPRPRRMEPYRRLFGERVTFDAERIVLRYDEATLRIPSAEADSELLAILEQHARQQVERLPVPSALCERLRVVIEQHLQHGDLSVQSAAKVLGLSERTLRRRLASAGVSYRDILDEVRRERALAYLNEGSLSISAISERLGFGDATSFTRNFQRWTGRTPSRTRRADNALPQLPGPSRASSARRGQSS